MKSYTYKPGFDIRVPILESERGWGSKIDSYVYFDNASEAKEFKKEYNKDCGNTVPDWYMVALDPEIVPTK